MRYPWLDWVVIGAITLAIVFFFSTLQNRAPVGEVIGGSVSLSPQDCVIYSSPSKSYLLSSSLRLCPNATHPVDYFDLLESEVVIDCQGSTIHGNGGALFVASIDQPTVTLRRCVVEGYDGLYSNQNPVNVIVEN